MKLAVWDITSCCNLRCKHCYNSEMYFKESIQDMSAEEIKHMMYLLVEGQFTDLQLLGGEPFVSSNLEDVLHMAKKNNISVYITTNGTIMNSNMINTVFNSSIKVINLSFESDNASKNDYIRGKGAFKSALENLKILIHYKKRFNSDLTIGISHTLTKYNYEELGNMIKFSAENEIDLLTITTFIDSGFGKENNQLFNEELSVIVQYMVENLPSILPKFPKLRIQLDMRPCIVSYLKRRFLIKNLGFAAASTDCLAGDTMWYITANGNLHPCNVMINQNIDDFPQNLITPEKVSVNKFDSFADIERVRYFQEFNELKDKEFNNRKKTCMDCDLKDNCFPCFIKLYSQEIIPECEIVQDEEKKYFETLNFIIPQFNDNILAYKGHGDLRLINLDNNKILELNTIANKIMCLVYSKYSIRDIIIKLDYISAIKIYRLLLDYRYDNILKF